MFKIAKILSLSSLLVFSLAACATTGTSTGGGSAVKAETNPSCEGGSALACVRTLETGDGCFSGGVESHVVNDSSSKTVSVKVATTMRPNAVGGKYPRTDTYELKPGESKYVGCSRSGEMAGRWLFYFNVTSAKFK